ncbi:metal-sensing transcriptional repressor [Anaerotalea alkaliphila]|uniref:Copper-sensing transcriptional repressor CsoR n=1 Tax=Anaerotalea alkaliphila TaxID=2662126 RepID=A0A7X5KN82_9FIRM|nr:metal-sensing transcriptional repressor [Anaerotalea alkaliphila]NDL68584.1 metal-sensing transcriptional repressor [Anaerotalea alkaliphila]
MNEDRKRAMTLLKTARGQVDGILRMLEEDRYCMDISTQIVAVSGLLRKANLAILEQHMNSCVKEAFLAGEGKGEAKVEEVMRVLEKYGR